MSKENGDAKIRLVELFAGIGAFSAAFRNTEIPHETVAIAEIDPHAIRAYTSIHGDAPNQAGNSIAVPVIEHIFRAMFIDKTWIRSPTLSHFVEAERGNEPKSSPN